MQDGVYHNMNYRSNQIEKNIGKVTLKYDPSRVKKDVLYKPLFRIFRNSLKELIVDLGE